MIKVSKKDFYKIINPLDVILNVAGKYPFVTYFKMRRVGVVVGKEENGEYYLTKNYKQ